MSIYELVLIAMLQCWILLYLEQGLQILREILEAVKEVRQ